MRPPRGWGRLPAKPANGTSTDSDTGRNPANDPSTDPVPDSKPANEASTDVAWPPGPGRAPAASACEPYREVIEVALASGRNAMAICARRQLRLPVDDNYTSPSVVVERSSLPVVVVGSARFLASSVR